MADDAGDKTEAPTPRRRTEAREQGNIAKSQDLSTAVALLAIITLLDWYGPNLIGAMKVTMERLLSPESLGDYSPQGVEPQLVLAVRVIGGAMAPLLLGVLLVAVLVNMAQVGLFFSTKRLQPNLAALNPLKGLNKLFKGRDNLVQMGMNVVKLAMIIAVAYSAVDARVGQILSTQQIEFLQIFGLGAQVIYSISLRIGMVLLLLAILDYAWHRWKIEQELKMTKQEVKDEMRRMEGDPKIKQRRRQMAMQRTMQGIKANVPTADVVVTNPTEFAVALKYDSGSMHAPRVVAKGTDILAMHIRQVAAEHGVPILERPPLARALYRLVDVGQEIPEQFYSVVAEILAYVYELTGKTRKRKEPALT